MDELTLLGASKTDYPKRPEEAKLEWFCNAYPDREYTIIFECPEFTSVCPKTGQPDFAKIIIEYSPGERCLESKSLKLYLFSFRNVGMFHEHIVNRICDDIRSAIAPRWIRVTGYMNPRGGISITVRAEWKAEA
jgi:7-cyano-7-deazaguanine reductase